MSDIRLTDKKAIVDDLETQCMLKVSIPMKFTKEELIDIRTAFKHYMVDYQDTNTDLYNKICAMIIKEEQK